MRVFIRADASESLGIGHIMRCLSLCEELKNAVEEIIFVCRNLTDSLRQLISGKGYSLQEFSSEFSLGSVEEAQQIAQQLSAYISKEKTDYLIIDHYGIDHVWEEIVSSLFFKTMVIDDLENRFHSCDILLDTNFSLNNQVRYLSFVPKHTTRLLGPSYALLRPEFIQMQNSKKFSLERSEYENKILICFGGTDPTNETLKTLQALEILNATKGSQSYEAVVILGGSNTKIKQIEEQYGGKPWVELLVQPPSMSSAMMRAGFAVCSAGSITWERYCMGLPAITIAIAENQIQIAEQGQFLGIDTYLGESENITASSLSSAISDFLQDSCEERKERRKKAIQLVDGEGAARVAKVLLTMGVNR
ncbi:UDP-2,4-diacetamido-2,4,6-trideoxy-beta-L-altropyranose hydrolase [Saccharibacillus sp. O16]|nr:UDP-2,4-diacetamido-2,4,6-trideoxy-beta-L-altropyranose hydrolase [Saccharibacillus sp. O16]